MGPRGEGGPREEKERTREGGARRGAEVGKREEVKRGEERRKLWARGDRRVWRVRVVMVLRSDIGGGRREGKGLDE